MPGTEKSSETNVPGTRGAPVRRAAAGPGEVDRGRATVPGMSWGPGPILFTAFFQSRGRRTGAGPFFRRFFARKRRKTRGSDSQFFDIPCENLVPYEVFTHTHTHKQPPAAASSRQQPPVAASSRQQPPAAASATRASSAYLGGVISSPKDGVISGRKSV